MLYRERLTVVVCREQCLRMACRRQVNRDEVRVGASRVVKVDRRLHASPLRSRHWGISTEQIIETQASPPGDCTPTFHADESGDLLMRGETIHECPNVDVDT